MSKYLFIAKEISKSMQYPHSIFYCSPLSIPMPHVYELHSSARMSLVSPIHKDDMMIHSAIFEHPKRLVPWHVHQNLLKHEETPQVYLPSAPLSLCNR